MPDSGSLRSATELGDKFEGAGQPLAVGEVVEPAALPGWVRQRDDHRLITKCSADAVLEPPGAEKAPDRQLTDRQDHVGPEQPELSVDPARAVDDLARRRAPVAAAARRAARKAAGNGRDVDLAAELIVGREAGAAHPPPELGSCPTGKRPPAFVLDDSWRLSDEDHARRHGVGEHRTGLGQKALLLTDAAAAAGFLEASKLVGDGPPRPDRGHAGTLPSRRPAAGGRTSLPGCRRGLAC